MDRKYFVAFAYRYKESKNWEYQLIGCYDELTAAKQAYYSKMGAIIKKTNDFAMCIIYDNFGNKIDSDFDDTHVEPAPEPTPEA